MSVTWQQSRIHALNNSSAKSSFAFGKQSRFLSTTRPLCDTFYNVTRNIKSSKGTSIGRGNKTSFGDKFGYPSPLQYNIRSSFDGQNKNGKGVKIGLGRQSLKYGGIFQKSQTPDPAHYTPRDPRMTNLHSGYTIRSKLPQQQMSYKKNPGPGQYNSISSISATGIYKLSTIPNCACPKIKLTKPYDPKQHEKTPGPGQYGTDKQNMNQSGKYFLSKYTDSRCRSFSKSKQYDAGKNSLVNLPGPGAYNHFSQFGARNKVIR